MLSVTLTSRPLLARCGLFFTILPFVANIGSRAWRRKMAERLPIPVLRELIECVDILQRESEKIVQEKKEALEKGDEGVQRLVSNGKDIMSVLCKLLLLRPRIMLTGD